MDWTNEKPAYWAVLPANVRYHNKISSTAKLLYAEITALSNTEGYCWASNDYFARLFEISPKQISRVISELTEAGLVNNEVSAGNQRKLYPQIITEVVQKAKGLAEKFAEAIGPVGLELEDEKKAFLEYWTAKNDGGKKEHWQKQTTFAIKQRWATWIKNKRDWERPRKTPTDNEIRQQAKQSVIKANNEKQMQERLNEVGQPRSPEEQAKINQRIADVRKQLLQKSII